MCACLCLCLSLGLVFSPRRHYLLSLSQVSDTALWSWVSETQILILQKVRMFPKFAKKSERNAPQIQVRQSGRINHSSLVQSRPRSTSFFSAQRCSLKKGENFWLCSVSSSLPSGKNKNRTKTNQPMSECGHQAASQASASDGFCQEVGGLATKW